VCTLGLAIGERMGLSEEELARVYRLALLRHIGCTAGSDLVAEIAGDEIELRKDSPRLDLADKPGMLPHVLAHIAATNRPLARPAAFIRLMGGMGRIMGNTDEICEAAATIANRLGLGANTASDLEQLHDRWDGKGRQGLTGDAISEPVRVVQVAESAAAFLGDDGADAAAGFVRAHRGGMFAPDATDAFLAAPEEVASALDPESLWDAVVTSPRAGDRPLDGPALDEACEVVADFADMRSNWLVGHSRGVSKLAEAAAKELGLPEEDAASLRRAGLVHDVGRVAVSASIWGKRGSLTRAEWEQVRLHPYHSERVLARPEWLGELGAIASRHHERCDGSGYFRGTRELTTGAKVLAAADCLHAMTEPRPHRPGRELPDAARELRAGARDGLYDADASEAVLAAAGVRARRRPDHAGGLSAREIEVLRLLARGLTKREIAKRLTIAPKTADAHTQHIYAKIGVSTRAGATLYAMKQGLLETLPADS
jgi:HD-GYP domain-containing protein (c-di-GMP phosphodiesterase class II)